MENKNLLKKLECFNVIVHVGCVLSLTLMFRSNPTLEQLMEVLKERLSEWSTENPLVFDVRIEDNVLFANNIKVEYITIAGIFYEN